MASICNTFRESSLLCSRFGSASIIPVRFRKARKPQDKLPPPEDRSKVVIGKIQGRPMRPQFGVSDKQHPILVKWNKPWRIETCNPSLSGDIGGLEFFGEVDKTKPPLALDGSKEFAAADAVVQKILSLDFARHKDAIARIRQDVASSIRQHKLDVNSLEVKIAMLTITIRNYQRVLIEIYPYKNIPLKHDLTYKIALRRSLIAKLREQDYRKFEWLLEKLNITYKPVPVYDHIEVSRKACIERLTDMWCDELKSHRLDLYKRSLQTKQPAFLKAKAEKLEHIMREEAELGLEPTVTQADIDECLVRAAEIESRNEDLKDTPQNYQVYVEEKVREQNFINTVEN